MREQAKQNMQQLTALYESYLDEARKVELSRKPGEGIFGIGKRPSDDPCHDRFYGELEKLLKAFAEEKPSSEDIRDVLDFMYRVPCDEEQPQSAVMPMNAVHSLTLELAERLSAGDAEALLEQYKKDYPRSRRFPVHKNVIKALERAR